jgi:hypothetical protein
VTIADGISRQAGDTDQCRILALTLLGGLPGVRHLGDGIL